MTPKQINGWTLTESKRGDAPVWRLTKEGRHPITLRLEAEYDEEIAVRHAMGAIDRAEANSKNKQGD